MIRDEVSRAVLLEKSPLTCDEPQADIRRPTPGHPVPGKCSACYHPERARIEALRVNGVSLRVLSDKFGISKDSVSRHFKTHVSGARRAELLAGPARVEQLANAAADESQALVDYLSITRSVLFNQFLSAAEAGDRGGVAFIAGKLLDALREHGKLTGELRQLSGLTINNTLNFVSSPSFLELQSGLLKIARAHPEARAEIVRLLRSLEAGPDAPKPTGAPLIEGEVEHVAA
jgi:hypothetical protein